jgi:hypothetical protein
MYAAAIEFGWQSYLQHGRSTATELLPFERVEPKLKEAWRTRQVSKQACQPWESAREAARDAWERVQDALLEGSPKPSAR